jgi:SAM-dependent methyltransferase
MECKICLNSKDLQEYKVKEMMFGLREEFSYFQCKNCKCLQISKIPDNMEKYYPSNYYSFNNPISKTKKKISTFLKGERNKYAVFNKGFIGKLIFNRFPIAEFRALSEIPITKESKILDVGCGSGFFLLELEKIGFKNLEGVDPFLEKDIHYDSGVKVFKKSIHEVKDKKDVIIFHHSFEHLADPLETLDSVSKLLNKGGFCIIRVPTSSSYAWKHYKENWVQLDAPRHFFIHSKESMQLLTEKVLLSLKKIVYDSTGFQFWGSEQYVNNIPLRDEKSYAEYPEESMFSKKQIIDFELKARHLNKKEEGDSCAFIIKKE